MFDQYSKLKQVFYLQIIILCIILVAGLNAQNNDLSDEEISRSVEDALDRSVVVSSHLIDVSTTDGIVTLSGTVGNILESGDAVRVAEYIKGVRSVVDNIKVNPPVREDEAIREDIMNAIINNPATEAIEVRVSVENGIVILEGNVESVQEKWLLQRMAKGVRGVRRINNRIIVESQVERSDSEIKADIEGRFAADFLINQENLEIEVRDGVVVLDGETGSAWKRSYLENAAYVTGVTNVIVDQVDVNPDLRIEEIRLKKEGLTDVEIKRSVMRSLAYDPRVYSFNVEVEVEEGVVTLTGIVNSLTAKRNAEQDAWNTIGVKDVDNRIKVRLEEMPPDNKIRQSVEKAIARDPFLDRFEITVFVSNGRTFLYGRLDTFYEQRRLVNIVSDVKGVIDIQNNTEVTKTWVRKSDRKIKEDIIQELKWDVRIGEDDIQVSVEDGVARLEGTVMTPSERMIAVQKSFEAGAKAVRSYLTLPYLPDIEPDTYENPPVYTGLRY